MKYFIPEWDDRVDPEYDFSSDTHSEKHREDPILNDSYIWDIYGLKNVPIDGVLVSRVTISKKTQKYSRIKNLGIHGALRLPTDFEVMGDCGAYGYVDQKLPPYDPLEILEYYRESGFNYGVTVDHLVVPQFRGDREFRMKVTYENAIKAYDVWSKNFREEFQLLAVTQGLEVSDYLNMYKNYLRKGIMYVAFGGLARSPTSFISKLVDELIRETRNSKKNPEYLHFFGLARFSLFPKFQELEDLGIPVGFDSASYLRKAWLSAPRTELNYLTLEGLGYSAIRIPFTSRRTKNKDYSENLGRLEKDCLYTLKLYDKSQVDLLNVKEKLTKFQKAIDVTNDPMVFYERTLKDKPWKSCDCPVCKTLGINVIIFRGNNRNRRRGFHNTYVFYKVLKNPSIWHKFLPKEEKEISLSSLEKEDNILVITECSKRKVGYSKSIRLPARQMYQGRLFKAVRNFCEAMNFDYAIISAKYGLLLPEDVIEGYEAELKSRKDAIRVQPLVEEPLSSILENYDKIVVIAGKRYRETLSSLWNDHFYFVKSRGYADLCKIVNDAIPVEKTLVDFS